MKRFLQLSIKYLMYLDKLSCIFPLSFCSGSLCFIQTDHLSLEKLHTTRLSCLSAAEEC